MSAKRSPAALAALDEPVRYRAAGGIGAHGARPQIGIQADDVGQPCRLAQHPLAAAADDDWRPARRVGQRTAHHAGDLVVLALVVKGLAPPQPLDDLQRLDHAVDAHAGPVERDARLLVVVSQPAGADAELGPALCQQVERGEVLRQHRGVPVIGGVHQRPHPQRRGDLRRNSGMHDGRPAVPEMVVAEQRRVAEILHLACHLAERSGALRLAVLDTKSERMHGGTLRAADPPPTTVARQYATQRSGGGSVGHLTPSPCGLLASLEHENGRSNILPPSLSPWRTSDPSRTAKPLLLLTQRSPGGCRRRSSWQMPAACGRPT